MHRRIFVDTRIFKDEEFSKSEREEFSESEKELEDKAQEFKKESRKELLVVCVCVYARACLCGRLSCHVHCVLLCF